MRCRLGDKAGWGPTGDEGPRKDAGGPEGLRRPLDCWCHEGLPGQSPSIMLSSEPPDRPFSLQTDCRGHQTQTLP